MKNEIHPLSDPQGWGRIFSLNGVRFSLHILTGALPSHVLCKDVSFQRSDLFLIGRNVLYELEAALAER